MGQGRQMRRGELGPARGDADVVGAGQVDGHHVEGPFDDDRVSPAAQPVPSFIKAEQHLPFVK